MFLVGEAEAVGGVVGGHVGEDELVAFFESIEDFDGVDRRAAKLHLYANCFCAVFNYLEESQRGICSAVDGASDVEKVVEFFDVDGGVDGEIGSSAARQGAVEGDVDGACAVRAEALMPVT